MGWTRESLSVGGVARLVDVHTGTGGYPDRLELAAPAPQVGDRFHLKGRAFRVSRVHDQGGRAERFEVSISVEPAEIVTESAPVSATKAVRTGKRKTR